MLGSTICVIKCGGSIPTSEIILLAVGIPLFILTFIILKDRK